MINLQISGVQKTIKNLMNYGNEIKTSLNRDINFIGEEVRNRLSQMYPDENITGIMESEFEYLITISGMIICKISGKRVLVSYEKYLKRKRERKEWGKTLAESPDWDLLVNEYLQEATQRINQSLNIILK